MRKRHEITDHRSCLSKAEINEPIFVLLGRDRVAALTIHIWCFLRWVFRRNRWFDDQLGEARDLASLITWEREIGITYGKK